MITYNTLFATSFLPVFLGNRDLFNYAQASVFSVKYLGHLKNVALRNGRWSSTETQTDTLEIIDTAQVKKFQDLNEFCVIL